MCEGVFFFCFVFGHKLKIQLHNESQNTTNPAEHTQPEWKSKNNAHMWPILPCMLLIVIIVNIVNNPYPIQQRLYFIHFEQCDIVLHCIGDYQS